MSDPVDAPVAVIGAGLVGRAWAIAFARAGRRVALWDPAAPARDAARGRIAPLLAALDGAGLLRGQAPDAVLERIAPAATLEDAVGPADHVQENAPEDLDAKRALFARLDAAAPAGAVLASSTSALLPSRIAEGLTGAARVLVAHPINPPYLVPAVEIVPGPATDEAAVARTAALMRAVGQSPIVMRRELPGFIMNRLQGALLEEAFRLVADGVASPEDVDRGVRDGLGLRWALMGPFETIDLNAPGGCEDYVARFDAMYAGIAEGAGRRADWRATAARAVAPARRAVAPLETLPAQADRRDRRLMALLRARAAMQDTEEEEI